MTLLSSAARKTAAAAIRTARIENVAARRAVALSRDDVVASDEVR